MTFNFVITFYFSPISDPEKDLSGAGDLGPSSKTDETNKEPEAKAEDEVESEDGAGGWGGWASGWIDSG